jgi:murein DD-endopeptidase MepM/ murein hydrolase activator NlpD
VRLDGRAVRVSPAGIFLIGFGRDAPTEARLELRWPDGSGEARTLDIARRTYQIQRIDGLPPRLVTPRPEDLARIRREAALVRQVRRRDEPRTDFLDGFVWPVNGRISGVYGSQRVLNGEPRRPHFGVDIAAPPGTPVKAPAAGVVSLAHPDMFYTGATLILDHGHGLSSAFLHLRDILVRQGQRVGRGEPIGTVGASGRATGPHLDWRVNWFDTRLDPALLAGPMVGGN